ncbi:MAG: pyridoxal-dependent decarboxylase [Gammaproteobacteria bacterium]|nr:pyridoxal-dependent decarboxylase [Gammaproteobacteria bacterium]
MSTEKAELGRLQTLLAQVGAGLDEYLRFEHADAFVNRAAWQPRLAQPLPRTGEGIDAVTRELVETLIPNGQPISKPGFTGYIVTGPVTASVLASAAASVASPARYLPTAFNLVEELSLEWLAELLGLGAMKGVYSSGGSVANLVGLGAARQHAFEKIGRDPALHGVDRAVRIYASEECHHTIQRSAGVLGLGRASVALIACDEGKRMRVDALRRALESDLRDGILPVAIVANAGATNTGAIDPIAEIGEVARAHGIWYHVDGAYGLPGILDPRVRGLYRGIEQADSVITDPHKWLGAAVGIAATFVHERDILERAFTQEASDYLEGTLEQSDADEPRIEHSMDDFGIPYFNYGLELSSPCRGVVVWAMLREIGAEGMRERIVRHNDMARELAARCRAHERLELLLEPTLSVCCFRYRPAGVDDLDEFNRRLHRRLVRENQYLPSTTRVDGRLALRPCFLGARTGEGQVEGLVDAILRIGAGLETELSDGGQNADTQL